MREDRDLLLAWADGDRPAGTEFYRRYADRVTRFFARKMDCDVADLVQRTFLKVLEAQKKGAQIESVGGYLFATARTELYEALREKQKRGRFEPAVTSLADIGTSPSQVFARSEQQRLLLAALRRIPLDAQVALELYYWERLSMQQVAEALGVTKSAAINRVHRAREQVRSTLAELDRPAHLLNETIKDFEAWVAAVRAG